MDRETLGLVGSVLLLLIAATVVVSILKRRVSASGLNLALVETFRARVRAWWILFTGLAAAFLFDQYLAGQTVTVVLFGLISFWALREFITLTPTRPGDHRALFWVFFLRHISSAILTLSPMRATIRLSTSSIFLRKSSKFILLPPE